MRKVLIALLSLMLWSCEKDMPPVNNTPYNAPYNPKPVDPVIIHPADSILKAIYIEESGGIIKTAGDTLYRSILVVKLWTKGGRAMEFDGLGKFLRYANGQNLIDTLGQVIAGNGVYLGWADYYPINKKTLDSAVFRVFDGDHSYRYLYADSNTKIIATSLPASAMTFARWVNGKLITNNNDGKGWGSRPDEGDGFGIIDSVLLTSIYFVSNQPIYYPKDTAGNFIDAISFEAGGKHYLCYGPGYRPTYTINYLDNGDFFDTTVAAVKWANPDDPYSGWADFGIRKNLYNKLVFYVELKNGSRTFILDDKTELLGKLYHTDYKFMCNWYNGALKKLRGVRFYNSIATD